MERSSPAQLPSDQEHSTGELTWLEMSRKGKIERREQLGATVAELAAKADVPARARHKAADVPSKAQATAAGLAERARPGQLVRQRRPRVLAIGLMAAAAAASWQRRKA